MDHESINATIAVCNRGLAKVQVVRVNVDTSRLGRIQWPGEPFWLEGGETRDLRFDRKFRDMLPGTFTREPWSTGIPDYEVALINVSLGNKTDVAARVPVRMGFPPIPW